MLNINKKNCHIIEKIDINLKKIKKYLINKI